MGDVFESDWQRLVRKTRRRPLIWNPVVVPSADGSRIRSNLSERMQVSLFALAFGGLLTWVGLFLVDWIIGQAIALLLGPFFVLIGLWKLLFPAAMFCREGSDDVSVRYGFILFPTRLTLDRQHLLAVLRIGAETRLPKAYRRFPVLLLRRTDNHQEACVGFSISSSEATAALDQLGAVLGKEGINSLAVPTRQDGRTVIVKKTATWQGGTQYRWQSDLSFREPGIVQIDRRPLARFKKHPFAPPYPVRVERGDEALHVVWSNKQEKSIPLSRCVGIQVCRGESQTTRYEMNLVLDGPDDNRFNLVSLDPVPHEGLGALRPDPQAMARQFAAHLQLPVLDHIL